MKRTFCLIMALCLIFLCSCANKSETSDSSSGQATTDTHTSKQFSLLYCVGDSINPYLAETTANRQLSLLIYDPLVKITPDFKADYVLASSIEQDGKDYIITLKSVKFSDGSDVTAADVVYSYKLAKASSTSYAISLEGINTFKADTDEKIKVTLKKADPYFANLLDFPVLKSGSDKLTDENKIPLPPIGSGRYVPDFDNLKLISNSSHILGKPTVDVINLINTPDNEVAKYNLEAGNVGIYHTDLSDGVIPPMSGNIGTVPLNHLVYLGINLNKKVLKNDGFRNALSSCINRSDVCDDTYHGYATPATGIFNPVWEDAKGLQNISSTSNTEIMVAYLEELGYNSKDEDGFYVNSKGKRLSFTLVYYSGNARRAEVAHLIAEQIRAAGIEITEKALNWESYVSALENGRFDLYVAEVKLLNNMDISELIAPGGKLAYGIKSFEDDDDNDEEAGTDEIDITEETTNITHLTLQGFYSGEYSLIDVINAFNAEMPIIPLYYPLGITVCDPAFSANNVSSVSDAYFGISNLK